VINALQSRDPLSEISWSRTLGHVLHRLIGRHRVDYGRTHVDEHP
jgi:hypothetical protein